MMSVQAEKPLEIQVLEKIEEGVQQDDPVSALAGPQFDRAIKRSIGLPRVNQGVLCHILKRLEANEQIRREVSTETYEKVLGSGRPKRYPMVTFYPV